MLSNGCEVGAWSRRARRLSSSPGTDARHASTVREAVYAHGAGGRCHSRRAPMLRQRRLPTGSSSRARGAVIQIDRRRPLSHGEAEGAGAAMIRWTFDARCCGPTAGSPRAALESPISTTVPLVAYCYKLLAGSPSRVTRHPRHCSSRRAQRFPRGAAARGATARIARDDRSAPARVAASRVAAASSRKRRHGQALEVHPEQPRTPRELAF